MALVAGIVIAASVGARNALAQATSEAGGQTPFELGVARFQAHDYRGALGLLERARAADSDDLDTALLLGICYYHLDRLDEAQPLLEAASASREAETANSAKVFLGLVADAHGDDDDARAYFREVASSSDSALAASARTWLRKSTPDHLSIVAMIRPEFDSNVALLPGTPGGPGRGPHKAAAGDADLFVLASIELRPFVGGLALEDTASYRQQMQQTDFDQATNNVGVRDQWGRRNRLSLAYHFEAAALGGEAFYTGHVADAGFRHALTSELGLGARYTFAQRSYALMDYAGYSGPSHVGAAEASYGKPDGSFELGLEYELRREDGADAALSATGQGGRARLHASLGEATDLSLVGLVMERTFDDASMGRRDLQIRGDLALVIGLGGNVGLILGGSALSNASTDSTYQYHKLVAFLGLDFTYSRR